jgi:predicted GH43/DUF377 family glycosyl hydrolase
MGGLDFSPVFAALVILTNISTTAALFALLLAVSVGFAALFAFWLIAILWSPSRRKLALERAQENPILGPDPTHWWESEAVFNPGAFVDQGRVHLFYRALGHDGISRIGYAESGDGVHFDRSREPVFDWGAGFVPPKSLSYSTLTYNTDTYASGGGWGGCEDPRVVVIDDRAYMTFGIFENWASQRMAVTSISLPELRKKRWKWLPHIAISKRNETNKNWVLFPEKINGKFAILHALTPNILIKYVDSLQELENNPIKSNNHRSGRPGHWDAFVRGAASPPIKTEFGWLLLYHGMNPDESSVGYKVGAMLLDLADPTKILYRTDAPILEPTHWYENDWKPGVVYASGAVVFGDDLIVYYGGGDKYIAAAKANLAHFLRSLTQHKNLQLTPVAV